MTRRIAALGLILLLLAAAVWALAGAPARRERDEARAEFARARGERERLRAQVAALERRLRPGVAPESGPGAARTLRSCLLAATRGLDVEGVRLQASAGGDRSAANGQLDVSGPTRDVLALVERLAQAGSGVLLQRVTLSVDVREPQLVRLQAAGLAVPRGDRP